MHRPPPAPCPLHLLPKLQAPCAFLLVGQMRTLVGGGGCPSLASTPVPPERDWGGGCWRPPGCSSSGPLTLPGIPVTFPGPSLCFLLLRKQKPPKKGLSWAPAPIPPPQTAPSHPLFQLKPLLQRNPLHGLHPICSDSRVSFSQPPSLATLVFPTLSPLFYSPQPHLRFSPATSLNGLLSSPPCQSSLLT